MSEQTTLSPVQTPATSSQNGKARKSAKKPAAKKASKASVKPSPNRAIANVAPGERRTTLIKLLRKLGAVKASSARDFGSLAERLGWSRFDVYGLVNGTSGKAGSSPTCLTATGHVSVATTEEGLAVYLTAKGQKTDFSEPSFTGKRSPKAK